MYLEGTQLSSEEQLEADVAIVGAGPAGIVLGLELAEAGRRVLLIDSGGHSFDPETQQLGETAGRDFYHAPASLTTRRQIGGASNLWAGRCVPFDPIDFQPRRIAGYARWPVAYEELREYFARACAWLMCGEAVFDAEDIRALAGRSLIPGWPGGDIRATALERWSLPTNFRHSYHSRLKLSPLITVATKLTCTEILCNPSGDGVRHLICQTLSRKRVLIRASDYVLACGGLESTRLLFASNRTHSDGIGNHSGHLGRWYMAHVESRIANVHFRTPPRETLYDYERDHAGVYVRRRFTFAPEFCIDRDLPNAVMWLNNPELAEPSHHSGVLSFIYLILTSALGPHLISEAIRLGQVGAEPPKSRREHVANVIRELGPTLSFALDFGYQRFLKRGRRPPGVFVRNPANIYPLKYHGEHLPHYHSRVVPAQERDALGMPRLRTELRFEDSDFEGAIRAHRHFDSYLREHKLGHLEFVGEDPNSTIRRQVFGGYHQAGTTRMAAEPSEGVLDPNLAVHGFDDLFVASSSAFVTSSQANTTFMIVVFALRLADHLRRGLPRETAQLAASHQ
ncbi:MAG TPA: GMC oxidoreductase [Solirubrobacteraceae bacterium]|jgi:choline dehydrogenase-like flavoprotein|nr:GMC oxidoreductase [Solirubrobacteraceae bacterium]